MPNAFNGANLAAALQAANVRGQHALLLNADIANSKLQTVLEEAGLRVSRVIAYRTIAAPTHAEVDVPTLIEKGWAHALTFTSPSTVRHFIERLSPTTLEAAKRLLAVCIGPTTAYAAHTAGFTSVIVAETATEDSLVEALAEASRSTLKRP